MGLDISLRLGHFLYNAGLLGMVRILEGQYPNSGLWAKRGSEIQLSSKVFETFHEAYCNQLIEMFGNNARCHKLLRRYEGLVGESTDSKEWRSFFKDLKHAIGSREYKDAAVIAKARGDQTDFDMLSAKLTDAKASDLCSLSQTIDEIVAFLKKHRDIFVLRDILNECILPYWGKTGQTPISFFRPPYTQKEVPEAYKLYFVDGQVDKFLSNINNPHYRAWRRCQECDRPISSSTGWSLSWIADFGTDVGKKTSDFYQGVPDMYICPICAIVYSCTPLGFFQINGEGLFINNNSSIEKLLQANNVLANLKEVSSVTEAAAHVRTQLARMITTVEIDRAARLLPQNIQIIRRKRKDGNPRTFEYRFEVLARDKLEILRDCDKELGILLKMGWMPITEKKRNRPQVSINVYDAAVSNLLDGRQQYPLIHTLLEVSWKNDQELQRIDPSLVALIVLRIEARTRGGNSMDESAVKQIYHARYMGQQLRDYFVAQMGSVDDAHNRLRGYAYYLLNALKGRDVHRFLDTVVRMYVGIGKPVPSIFAKGIRDAQAFLDIGYAYIIGLKGEGQHSSLSPDENKGLGSPNLSEGGVRS